MQARQRTTLGRLGLILWLLIPFVMVGALWFSVDRTQGERGSPSALRLSDSDERADAVRPETLPRGFVLRVVDESRTATEDDPLYVASNHNGWNPRDRDWRMAQREPGVWEIVVRTAFDSPMRVRFTRGSWETAEADADGEPAPERELPALDPTGVHEESPPVIEFTLRGFVDRSP